MKVAYRDCEIEIMRNTSMNGIDFLFFSVIAPDGFEIISEFEHYEKGKTIPKKLRVLRDIVDLYHENPKKWRGEE